MNKLQICQRVLREVDRDPSLMTTAVIADLANSQHKNVAQWVEDAYSYIQSSQSNWGFHFRDGTILTTVADQKDYAAGQVRELLPTSVKYRKVGTTPWANMIFYDYVHFKEMFLLTNETTGAPIAITRLPNEKFRVYPTPSAAYEISGPYYMNNDTMTHDAAVPLWHEDLHEILVWKAAQYYWHRYQQPEGMKPHIDGQMQRWWLKLCNRYLPDLVY